ncbi:NADPH:quinone reductase [Amycolatopsis deserti]|uniref:NADPH:quinone reductase n=1 Tax=Amycolatopsis deserti TaxID=185696 RepID=A0ABQ3IP17_9PSEU|nr:NADP-dependent oxidoreductase [Amycolatopsis deserti]GHE89960.1 NADPH:quinone reductase [Amycolatopsis deserti]
MRAVRYHEYGGAEVLRHEEAERPEPGPGQVLIQVAGTSFNPVDALLRAGELREAFPLRLPHIPGVDVSGTVAETGDGVTGFRRGDAVIGFLPIIDGSAAAEYVLAPAEALTAAPESVPAADAAALPVVGLTAWQALFELGEVRAGQRVLVNGAGGAVGGYAVQLAARAGATVVGTARDAHAGRLRSYGAAQVVGHGDWDAVREPVDVVVNLAPETPPELTALVRDGGIVVTSATPPEPDESRGVRAARVFVRSDAAQLRHLAEEVDAGRLRIHVADRRPLSELAAVHEEAAAGKLAGKTVLLP